MATEVEVRNFQSIEHATIKIEGYTALVGRSNIGKSALVRAIKAALTGATGTDFVRHSESCARRVREAKTCKCKTTVRIKREGFDLLWEKGDSANQYTYNGTVYTAVERGTPSFLQDSYQPIKIGETKELLQVAGQFEPIYLLGETGTVVADVLSDVAHLDRINVAMRLVEKDRKEAVSTRKVREGDIVTVGDTLKQYDNLDDAVSQLRAVEAKLTDVERSDARVRRIERFLEAGAARAVEIRHLQGVEAIADPPDAGGMRDAATAAQRLAGWWDRLVGHRTWFERMKGLEGLSVPERGPLTGSWTALGALDDLATSYTHTLEELSRLEAGLRKATEDVAGIQAEWDALGVCPTCAQPCRGHMADEAV